MPISSGWDNDEKTIYRYTVSGRWTMAEFLEHSQQFRQAMAEVNHPVYTIVDTRKAKISAGNLMEAAGIVFGEPLPNDELLVIINTSPVYRRTMQTIEKMMMALFLTIQPPIVWVKSDTEAYEAIEQYRRKRRPPES